MSQDHSRTKRRGTKRAIATIFSGVVSHHRQNKQGSKSNTKESTVRWNRWSHLLATQRCIRMTHRSYYGNLNYGQFTSKLVIVSPQRCLAYLVGLRKLDHWTNEMHFEKRTLVHEPCSMRVVQSHEDFIGSLPSWGQGTNIASLEECCWIGVGVATKKVRPVPLNKPKHPDVLIARG